MSAVCLTRDLSASSEKAADLVGQGFRPTAVALAPRSDAHDRSPGRDDGEADLQRFFRVTPPVVHQMIKTLAARRFIEREPGTARSIRLRLTRAELPDLE